MNATPETMRKFSGTADGVKVTLQKGAQARACTVADKKRVGAAIARL